MKYDMSLVESLRPLTKEEYSDLEDSCLEHGILDEIKVWNGYLVDGRHRIKIADKHKLRVTEREMEFSDIAEARQWIIKNQLGKRNLSHQEMSKLRAELAESMSIQDVADTCGVSYRTVYRDVEAENAKKLASADIAKKCESGEIINSKADWARFGELDKTEREATEHKLRTTPGISLRAAIPKKKQGVNSDEINSMDHISYSAKRAIASGRVSIDSESVKKLKSLPAESQELLSTILEDQEVKSLKQGLSILDGAVKPRTQEESVRNILLSIEKLADRIHERLNDLNSVGISTDASRKVLTSFIYSVKEVCNG